MKHIILSLSILLSLTTFLLADISLPKKDNYYDRAGRAFANIAFAPARLLTTPYESIQRDGLTVGASKGAIQGIGRMFSDMGLGIFELITSPFPMGPGDTYGTHKRLPYDSMRAENYPPADLEDNWY